MKEKAVRFGPLLYRVKLFQLQVAFLDPADLLEGCAQDGAEDGGDDEADEQQAQPVHGGRRDGDSAFCDGCFGGSQPAGPDADLTAQTAGAHAGIDGCAVHLHVEDAGGDGACDG